jgi:hypothetical protein
MKGAQNLEVSILNLLARQYPIIFKGDTYRQDLLIHQCEVTVNLISHKKETEVNH